MTFDDQFVSLVLRNHCLKHPWLSKSLAFMVRDSMDGVTRYFGPLTSAIAVIFVLWVFGSNRTIITACLPSLESIEIVVGMLFVDFFFTSSCSAPIKVFKVTWIIFYNLGSSFS